MRMAFDETDMLIAVLPLSDDGFWLKLLNTNNGDYTRFDRYFLGSESEFLAGELVVSNFQVMLHNLKNDSLHMFQVTKLITSPSNVELKLSFVRNIQLLHNVSYFACSHCSIDILGVHHVLIAFSDKHTVHLYRLENSELVPLDNVTIGNPKQVLFHGSSLLIADKNVQNGKSCIVLFNVLNHKITISSKQWLLKYNDCVDLVKWTIVEFGHLVIATMSHIKVT